MTSNKHYCPPDCELFMKCHPVKEENHIIINNANCPLDKQGTSAGRPCQPAELVKNGGFEQNGVFGPIADWNEQIFNILITTSSTPVYEGGQTALFASQTTPETSRKDATLSQEVIVTPGCFLTLSFADNFFRLGEGFENLRIRARVFYNNGNEVDLINTEIIYRAENEVDRGFAFHQKGANNPVPANVNSVTVAFNVVLTDTARTVWLLDGVSLRAV